MLQGHVLHHKLHEFNAAAISRNQKWKQARTKDDLGAMKEKDFLDVLQAISVIGKSVRQELQVCLTLRNSCGHPSSLQVGENRVASHIESLVLNVFSAY